MSGTYWYDFLSKDGVLIEHPLNRQVGTLVPLKEFNDHDCEKCFVYQFAKKTNREGCHILCGNTPGYFRGLHEVVTVPTQTEQDPSGIDSHAPGAKLDKGKLRAGLVINGFANALTEVCKVGTFGANKYSDNGWMSVESGVSRYTDAMHRHFLKEASGELVDEDSGLLHAAHAAWNALARLELMIKENK